jgi:hypothetical protein
MFQACFTPEKHHLRLKPDRLLGMVLIFGVTLVGCKQDAEANPFVGTWSGSMTVPSVENGAPVSATLVFTETTWKMTPLSGTYTHSGNTANLTSNDTGPGSATLTGNNLALSFPSVSATGSFTKQ